MRAGSSLVWPEPRLSPSAHLSLLPGAAGEGPEALAAALAAGTGPGLWHLATALLTVPLPEPLAFLREVGKRYLTRLGSLPDLDVARLDAPLSPGPDDLEPLVERAPPFAGAEYVSLRTLRQLWQALDDHARALLAPLPSVDALLAAHAPLFRRVGRVAFHLVDHRHADGLPFAFLATFAHRVSDHGALQHLPLLRALQLYGASGDKGRLLRLLEPLDRAAQASPFVARLVADQSIYQPLSLGAAEAYALLREAPAIEAAGVAVRLPDWWQARPRPVVRAQVGAAAGRVGVEGLLDFRVQVALGDEALTADEVQALLQGGDGLVSLRGRWVEVDRQKLREALGHWQQVEALAAQGLSFAEAMRLCLGFEREGLGEAPAEVSAWSRVEPGPWLAARLDELRAPPAQRRDEQALGELRATLRPYQQVGVRWLRLLGELGLGACLADDMGLGKTVQVIGALWLRHRARPDETHLIVAPTSLLPNWSAELARFAPGLRVAVAHPSAGRGEVDEQATVVLTSYGMLARLPWLRERAWGVVVLDEAQAIKTPSSRQARLARELRAAARVAMTGTPVENRLGDLWSLFEFLNPGLLGSARAFGAFLKDSQRREGSLGRLRGLVRPYLLRRLKVDPAVAADLPPRTQVPAYCLLTRRQAALYQAEVDALRAALAGRDGIARRGAVLAAMTRLKQICDHPSLLLGDGSFEVDDSGKLQRLVELADEIAQRQEKALIFTQFREFTAPLVALLTRVFGSPGLCLHGGTRVAERKAMVESFQRDEGPPFFVLSLKAGGVGLNLTQASHVIHVDRWWNPAVEDQATDRAHRIGQKRAVLVHTLLCRGTLDERIEQMIDQKRVLAREVTAPTAETLLTELPDDDLLRLVRLDMSAVSGDG